MNEQSKHGVVTYQNYYYVAMRKNAVHANMGASWKSVKGKQLDTQDHILHGGMSRAKKSVKKT